MLAWVKAQDDPDDPPTLRHAVEQVEASRQAWQGAKPRVMPSRRMQRAKASLYKVKRQMARLKQSIDELDRWYDTERQERQRQLTELRARARERELELADISREAAGDYVGEEWDDGAQANEEIVQTTARVLGSDVGPLLEQLTTTIPEGTEAHAQATRALSAVTALYTECLQKAQKAEAENYDMAMDEWNTAEGTNWWDDQGWGWHGHWSQGEWHHYGSGAADTGSGGAMDTSPNEVPPWMRDDAAHANDLGERACRRARKNDDDGLGTQGRVAGAAAQANAEQARAHEQTARSQAEQGVATDGNRGAAAATGGSAEALHVRREAIIQQAKFDGIDVDPEAIAAMGSEQLERWAEEHLL